MSFDAFVRFTADMAGYSLISLVIWGGIAAAAMFIQKAVE